MGRVRAGSWVKPGLGVADAPLNMWEPLYLLPVPLLVQFSSVRGGCSCLWQLLGRGPCPAPGLWEQGRTLTLHPCV